MKNEWLFNLKAKTKDTQLSIETEKYPWERIAYPANMAAPSRNATRSEKIVT